MKKALSSALLTLFSLILTINAAAQERHYGIKGGAGAYEISSEIGDMSATSDPKIGFEAGIFGDFPINEILSIQPEVVFVQKGGENEDSNDFSGTPSVTLNYVDVPLLLKINAPLDGNIKPYIFGGPYAGYLVEASSNMEGNNVDLTEYLAEFHYGVKMGLGVNIGPVVIDARYDLGLADLYAENEEFDEFGEFKLTTAGFVLAIGLTF